MAGQRLEILAPSVRREGISGKGKKYSMDEVQVAVREADGSCKISGPMILPRDHPPITAPGEYLATFAFGRSMDGKVQAVIDSLAPVVAGRQPAKAA